MAQSGLHTVLWVWWLAPRGICCSGERERGNQRRILSGVLGLLLKTTSETGVDYNFQKWNKQRIVRSLPYDHCHFPDEQIMMLHYLVFPHINVPKLFLSLIVDDDFRRSRWFPLENQQLTRSTSPTIHCEI